MASPSIEDMMKGVPPNVTVKPMSEQAGKFSPLRWRDILTKKKQWTLARLCQIVFRTLLGDLTFNNLSEKTVAIFCTINL